jgi:hypothetical protein
MHRRRHRRPPEAHAAGRSVPQRARDWWRRDSGRHASPFPTLPLPQQDAHAHLHPDAIKSDGGQVGDTHAAGLAAAGWCRQRRRALHLLYGQLGREHDVTSEAQQQLAAPSGGCARRAARRGKWPLSSG